MGAEVTAFVPFADLLNHNHSFTALWTTSKSSQEPGFVITAPQGAKAGAQLLASYGAKDHSEFFRVYGFADEHAPREVVFHVDLERRDPLRGLRQAALLEINAYRTFTIRSGEEVMPFRDFELLMAFLRAAAVDEPAVLEEATGLLRPMGEAREEAALRRLRASADALAEHELRETAPALEAGASLALRTCRAFREQRAEVFRGIAAFAARAVGAEAPPGSAHAEGVSEALGRHLLRHRGRAEL